MKSLTLVIFLLSLNIHSQNEKACGIQKSEIINVKKVDKNDLICIAQNSSKPYTVFYTLTSWCSPCRMHFPDAVELERTGKVNLFVVLVESEDDKNIVKAIDFIKSVYPDVQFGVLKDDLYGTATKKRNKKLATEITPANNELIDDYGKFILVDKSGNVMYVTNYKDYNKEWKNSKKMIENKILPLLN